jgi:hypothetical protein
MQVVAIALEDIVLFDSDFNVQIPWRATIGARLAIASRADAQRFGVRSFIHVFHSPFAHSEQPDW